MDHKEAATIINETTAARTLGEIDYKVADAITDAQYYRAHPEVIVGPTQAKRVIDTLLAALEASPCYFKGVREGIPTFTLLAYDFAGHLALTRWIMEAQDHGCRPEKVVQARGMLAEWARRTDLRWPK